MPSEAPASPPNAATAVETMSHSNHNTASKPTLPALAERKLVGENEHEYKVWTGQACSHMVGSFYAGDSITWSVFLPEDGMTLDIGIHFKSAKSRWHVMDVIRTDVSSGTIVVPDDFKDKPVDFEISLDNQFSWFAPKEVKVNVKYEARRVRPTFRPATGYLKSGLCKIV
jgi:hypothetical protein